MVKKSTFLEKLFRSRRSLKDAAEERRTGRSRRAERPGTVQGAPSGQRAARAAGAPAPADAADLRAALETAAQRGIEDGTEPGKQDNGADEEPRRSEGGEAKPGGVSRVFGGRREEAVQAITDGFRDLSHLLNGIRDHMKEQNERSGQLGQRFSDLPAMAKAQVDFMAKVSQQLVEQKAKTSELLSKLGGLPDVLQGIHKTLERHTAVEERTEKNLKDFRATMDRIHSSIGLLSKESQKAVKDATASFERSHGRATRVFEETQKQAYDTFEKTQAAHLTKLEQIVERSGRTSRGVVVLLVMVFAALVALFAVVAAQAQ